MNNKLLYIHLVYHKSDEFVDDYISKVLYSNSNNDIHAFLINNMKKPFTFYYHGKYDDDPKVYPMIFVSHGDTFTALVKDAIHVATIINTFNASIDYLCIKDMDDIYFDSVPNEVFYYIDPSKVGAVYFNEETVRGDKVSKEYGDLPDKEFSALELSEWACKNKGPVFIQRQFKFIHIDVAKKLNEYFKYFYPNGDMGEDSLYTLAIMLTCNELNKTIYCSNKIFGQYVRNQNSSTLSLSNEDRFMQFTSMHLDIISWYRNVIKDTFSNRLILYRFLSDRTKGQLTSYEYYKNK